MKRGIGQVEVLATSGSGPAGSAQPAFRPASWGAHLELRYRRSAGRTVVDRRHRGPLLVQRPFHPESDGTCHSYVLHPPGGVAGGDTLTLEVRVDDAARCVLTAPGATKFYRAPGAVGRQRIVVTVASGGVCEHLPMETILFDGANAVVETEVDLARDATFVGWDLVSLGRPAADERFVTGSYVQRLRIRREGRPIWIERAAIGGGDPILTAPHGLRGHPIFGTMVYAGDLPGDAAEAVRSRLPATPGGEASISQLDDVVVCRYAGPKVSAARAFFVAAWDGLRRIGQGKPAVRPRIWAT